MRRPDLLGDPGDFGALIEDLDCPTIPFGQLRIVGREGWMRACPRLTPLERRALLRLPAFRRHLIVATAGGRARVRRGLDTERLLPAMTEAERRAWIQDRVSLYGDEDFLGLITSALMCLPEYIVAQLVREVAFVGVGRNSTGWFSSTAFLNRAGDRLPHTVVLGPAVDVPIALHECAHAWYAPLASETRGNAISVQGQTGLYQLAAAEGWTSRIDDYHQREERLAWAFAYAFL